MLAHVGIFDQFSVEVNIKIDIVKSRFKKMMASCLAFWNAQIIR